MAQHPCLPEIGKKHLMPPLAHILYRTPYLPQFVQNFNLWRHQILLHTKPPFMAHNRLVRRISASCDTYPPFTTHIHLSWQPYMRFTTNITSYCTVFASHGIVLTFHGTYKPLTAHIHLLWHVPAYYGKQITFQGTKPPTSHTILSWHELVFYDTYPPFMTHIRLWRHVSAFHGTLSLSNDTNQINHQPLW